MKCPKCSRPVDHEADTCYSCGFSIVDAREIFGANGVQMSRVQDAAHCLRKRDRDELEDTLDSLQARFPQVLFCTYLDALNQPDQVTQLGFWLVNHATVKGAEFARPNENAFLVILDLNHKQIGFSLGYFAEFLLTEEDAYRVLQAARPYLVNGDHGRALCVLFKKLGRVLSKRARQLKKRRYEPRPATVEVPNLLELPPHPGPVPEATGPVPEPSPAPEPVQHRPTPSTELPPLLPNGALR
ncbi:MAG: hypothetical protein HKN23_15040 [Verrucomicrobiales bacterium]|nr:hypothetical protein [Verrucomicrobiales bacterium]